MPEAENKEFKCRDCGKILYSEEALQQHTDAKHVKKQESAKSRSIKASHAAVIAIIILIAGAFIASSFIKPPVYEPRGPHEEKYTGSPDATVTMIEFSDFQCPFCARFTKDTKPLIADQYVSTGYVKFVFKHYILPGHTNAQKAAEAAECAADIGGMDAFWMMHDKMFANNNLLTDNNLKRFASEAGLNMTEFNACLDSGAMRGRVLADQTEGRELGIKGTPAFFINGEKIEGAQPFAAFKTVIDSKLNA